MRSIESSTCRDRKVFELVYGDRELVLALPLEPHVQDRLAAAIVSANDADHYGRENTVFVQKVVDVLTALVEADVLPPTDNQIKYAISIARTLNLQLRPEVLQYRDAMAAFLSKHAEEYRKKKNP